MTIEIQHNLEQYESKVRIKSLISDLSKKYPDLVKKPKEKWNNYHADLAATIKGVSVNGTIEIKEGVVVLDFGIPLVALMFKRKIETEVRVYLQKYLG